MNNTDLYFDEMRDKALRQLRSGESLYGKGGAFAPLLKQFLEAVDKTHMLPPVTGMLTPSGKSWV